ncbi:MAG: hypothetical protein IPO27_18325 [Bacteroidetes bacterium]|nr:hypothetical protein [Bacteroidota bacterium]
MSQKHNEDNRNIRLKKTNQINFKQALDKVQTLMQINLLTSYEEIAIKGGTFIILSILANIIFLK